MIASLFTKYLDIKTVGMIFIISNVDITTKYD